MSAPTWEGASAADAAPTGGPKPARLKWHYIYFLLAAFDLFTVSAGLYLTHEIMNIYTRSVAVNQRWTERAAEFSHLGDLAGAVNAPGNDVFDTRDVPGESAKMRAALVVFEREVANLRSALAQGATPEEAGPLLAHFDHISAAMKQMIDEANLIFTHFRGGRPNRAGERMASMDRKFAVLNSAIAQLRVAVTEIQHRNFERQTAAAQHLQEYEYVIGLLILGMVAAATVYGHRIVRQMQAHEAEKQRHLAALSEAEARIREERDHLQALNEKLQQAQTQLLQADKMSSIGQLAAGVAHEINNPMGFVNSNLAALQRYVQGLLYVLSAYESAADPVLADFPERRAPVLNAKADADLAYLQEDLPKLLDETKDGVMRVRKIVQDLKEFSHPGGAEWQLADLHQGLDSTLNVVRNEIKYKAEVIKEYGQLPPVECILSQINQVFMNLLVNAAHAIEQKGTITIRSGVEEGMTWVEIEDTGSGISPENLKRIFEPFFTTKPVGKGTGLGLSVCYSIAKKHGGRIDVRSEVNKGTAFKVWLPVKRAESSAEELSTADAA